MTGLKRRSPRAISAMNDRKTSSSWSVISFQYVHLHQTASPSERRLRVKDLVRKLNIPLKSRRKLSRISVEGHRIYIFWETQSRFQRHVKLVTCHAPYLVLGQKIDGQNEFHLLPCQLSTLRSKWSNGRNLKQVIPIAAVYRDYKEEQICKSKGEESLQSLLHDNRLRTARTSRPELSPNSVFCFSFVRFSLAKIEKEGHLSIGSGLWWL